MRYSICLAFMALSLTIYGQTPKADNPESTEQKRTLLIQAGGVYEISDNDTKAKGVEAHAKFRFTGSKKFSGLYLGIGALFFPGKDYYLLQPQARLGWMVETKKMAYDFGANACMYSGEVADEKLVISSVDIGLHMSAILKLKDKKGIYAAFNAPAILAPAEQDINIGSVYYLSIGIIL